MKVLVLVMMVMLLTYEVEGKGGLKQMLDINNKLGLSCAKLRTASLLRLLILVNSKLCKCEKLSTSSEVNKVK